MSFIELAREIADQHSRSTDPLANPICHHRYLSMAEAADDMAKDLLQLQSVADELKQAYQALGYDGQWVYDRPNQRIDHVHGSGVCEPDLSHGDNGPHVARIFNIIQRMSEDFCPAMKNTTLN